MNKKQLKKKLVLKKSSLANLDLAETKGGRLYDSDMGVCPTCGCGVSQLVVDGGCAAGSQFCSFWIC